jgi:membrane protease YdiL (CAAX protease family)
MAKNPLKLPAPLFFRHPKVNLFNHLNGTLQKAPLMKGREQLARISRIAFKSDSSAPKSGARFSYELLTLPLPFILWFLTFIYPPFTFWPTLALSTAILFAVSLPRLRSVTFKPTLRGVAIGVASGALLYAFFWAGAHVANSIPGFPAQVSAVYAFQGTFPIVWIAALLLFPIAPAEALYWQGLILRHLNLKTQPWKALILTSFLYTMIHLPTLNPSLMFVSLIVGLTWGFLYTKLGSNLFPVMVSHIIFDEFAFVFFMIA